MSWIKCLLLVLLKFGTYNSPPILPGSSETGITSTGSYKGRLQIALAASIKSFPDRVKAATKISILVSKPSSSTITFWMNNHGLISGFICPPFGKAIILQIRQLHFLLEIWVLVINLPNGLKTNGKLSTWTTTNFSGGTETTTSKTQRWCDCLFA